MSIEASLKERSGNKCELCSSVEELKVFSVPPLEEESADRALLVCTDCLLQIEDEEKMNINHWHCLNESMWSEHAAVQVMAFRILKRLTSEGWAQDLLEQLYLEDETRKWAEAGLPDENAVKTLDSNGAELADGDTVTLIKDLVVKGGGFTAKRGTTVKSITLTDNPQHIEGQVNGTRIVLVADFLKKA